MPMPVLGPYAAELYEQLTPLQHREAELDYPLAKFVRAFCLSHEAVEEVARESGTGDDPFSILLDLPRAPSYVLPWLAQFIGATIPPGLSDAQQRARISAVEGYHRGTPAAMRAAIQETLTGSKTVSIRERSEGNAYRLAIETYTGQTPDPAATRAAIEAHKPAGVVLTYSVLSGVSYDVLQSKGTYTQLDAAYGTYDDMSNATS